MISDKTYIRCVIIDDETESCDRLESLLNKMDAVEVLSKETNADKGIETVLKSEPDLIFLDVEMPGKSGFDVAESIRAGDVSPTFIFVTGYDQYAIKAIRSAAFDYLLKPVDIDELRETLERYMESEKDRQKQILPQKLKTQYLLTDREIEIITFLLEGKSSKEIAEELFISKHTVDTHRRNILGKMQINSTRELQRLFRLH